MSGIVGTIQGKTNNLGMARDAASCLARCACAAELRAVCAILFGLSALCLPFLSFRWLVMRLFW